MLFFSLFALLFQAIFNYTLTTISTIYIASDLGGSSFITTYAISFYATGNALGVPLGRAIAGHIGMVRLLKICLILFIFFSLLLPLSPTYFLFVTFRFLQGFVAGPFYILIALLFAQLAPKEKRSLFTSITVTIFVTGPVLGATFGGWIAYDYDWRYIFYFNLPVLILLYALLSWKFRDVVVQSKPRHFDGVGYFFYFISIFALSVVLIMGQELDWFRSNIIIASTIIAGIGFPFFVLWSLKSPTPILDFRLFKNIELPFALLHLLFLFSTYFGIVILLGLWLNLYVNYTPIWIGILIGTMAVSGLLPTFLITNRLGKRDPRFPLVLAIIFLAISSFHTSYFNVEIDFERIAMSRIMAGFGLALFLPPIFRLSFRSFPEEKTGDVVVMFQFVRAIASGLGASLYVILWQRRDVFYHDRLGSQLTAFDFQTTEFFERAKQFHLQGQEALAQLDVFLERQSIALALDDCFYFMGWVMVGLFVINLLSLFFRKIDFAEQM